MRDSQHYKRLKSGRQGKEPRNPFFLKTRGFETPGPGIVTPNNYNRKSAPKFGFGSSKREKDYLALAKASLVTSPGPGSYKIPV